MCLRGKDGQWHFLSLVDRNIRQRIRHPHLPFHHRTKSLEGKVYTDWLSISQSVRKNSQVDSRTTWNTMSPASLQRPHKVAPR